MLALLGLVTPAGAEPAHGRGGVVATGHPLATEAGLNALTKGGNAVDAAMAAALTLGVVDGHNSGIGGGCFILIRLASGECVAIDGRETAPAAAHRDMFLQGGKADTRRSQIGPLASGTPGALAAYETAASKYGKLPLEEHLLAAAAIAENGFAINGIYAGRLKGRAGELAAFESSRAVFLKPDGQPFAEGETLKQPDLARTYRAIASEGVAWFYDGPFARAADDWMGQNGGALSEDDFRNYRCRFRDPIHTTYRGYEIVGFPPPSSGGVHVLQLLNIVENFDLRGLHHHSADSIHVVAESMKLAFADRAFWLGDPEFVPVPRGLLAKTYAKQLAGQITMHAAAPVPGHGTPERATDDLFEKHTTHFSTADAAGNWVACTATINTSFGSQVVVPGTGVILNNQMDDFSIQPGVPNAFNLIGGEANAVAPGKRPLSSMSPTIVLKEGQPVLAAGAAGGPTIISQTLLTIINFIDFEMPVEAAVASPRFHHQWQPDELRIERAIAAEVREELRKRGHKLSETDTFGVCQAVGRREVAEQLTGIADPRAAGSAAGH
ncbi:MAG: gamma-glutamyltransferase [Verrucomicrobiota bacterium]|nr:gamma-glutamyltransferase [Verrucomicrobiota bacterium]